MVEIMLTLSVVAGSMAPAIGQAAARAITRLTVPVMDCRRADVPRPLLRIGRPPPLKGYRTW